MGNAKITAKVDGDPTVVVDLKASPEGYLLVDSSAVDTGVQSVTAGDPNITIGGTATDPTVAVTPAANVPLGSPVDDVITALINAGLMEPA